jgi:hypothetical protein
MQAKKIQLALLEALTVEITNLEHELELSEDTGENFIFDSIREIFAAKRTEITEAW